MNTTVQYPTPDPSWERAARTSERLGGALYHVSRLHDELTTADTIITVLLGMLTKQQRFKVAREMEAAGVSFRDAGISDNPRRIERRVAIDMANEFLSEQPK